MNDAPKQQRKKTILLSSTATAEERGWVSKVMEVIESQPNKNHQVNLLIALLVEEFRTAGDKKLAFEILVNDLRKRILDEEPLSN